MDVKTTFLNGFLKKELYMMQPEGFVDPKNADKVCKLQRSIYGLVQASRSWNIRFDEMIKASLLQDAANATLRSETLRRNCVRCNNRKRWCKRTVKKGGKHLRWWSHQIRFRF